MSGSTAKRTEGMMVWRNPLGMFAVAICLLTGTTGAKAQDPSIYPDWSGQWTRGPGMGNGWDPTKPQGLGQQAPLTPEYRAIFEATLADRAQGGLGGDPTGLCLPHGMPRMMIGIYPIEFIVTPKVSYILTDYTTHRRIFTDGRAWPKELLPGFNGTSIGKWLDADGDGRYDLLEVETRGFNWTNPTGTCCATRSPSKTTPSRAHGPSTASTSATPIRCGILSTVPRTTRMSSWARSST